MSFLALLESDLSDAELLAAVSELEDKYCVQPCEFTDEELIRAYVAVENSEFFEKFTNSQLHFDSGEINTLLDNNISNDELLCTVEDAEQWGSVTHQELCRDVEVTESSLDNILQGEVNQALDLCKYQGPAVPVPTFKNSDSVAVIPSTQSAPPRDCATFDLGFLLDEDDGVFKVPEVLKPQVMSQNKDHPFKQPHTDEEMYALGMKKFAGQTSKKICWVLHMYHTWRNQCNCNPDLHHIYADLDQPGSLRKPLLAFGVSRFVTEVTKVNGQDFPPKTLYEMVMCIQMYLKSVGIFWKLLDDSDEHFIPLRYTVDNIMKECAAGGIGSFVCQAQVLIYEDEAFL